MTWALRQYTSTNLMPARLPLLPRLRLFTGPNCSLCEVAKSELRKVQATHPFTLDIVDIHSDQGKVWKKKYEWWIPVLHLEDVEIAKGRWNQHDVKKALDTWRKDNPS